MLYNEEGNLVYYTMTNFVDDMGHLVFQEELKSSSLNI